MNRVVIILYVRVKQCHSEKDTITRIRIYVYIYIGQKGEHEKLHDYIEGIRVVCVYTILVYMVIQRLMECFVYSINLILSMHTNLYAYTVVYCVCTLFALTFD